MKKVLLSLLALLGSCVEVEGFGRVYQILLVVNEAKEKKVIFYNGNLFAEKGNEIKLNQDILDLGNVKDGARSYEYWWDGDKNEWCTRSGTALTFSQIKSIISSTQPMMLESEDIFPMVEKAYDEGVVYIFDSAKGELVEKDFTSWNPASVTGKTLVILFLGGIGFFIYRRVRKWRKKKLAEVTGKQEAEVAKKQENASEAVLEGNLKVA